MTEGFGRNVATRKCPREQTKKTATDATLSFFLLGLFHSLSTLSRDTTQGLGGKKTGTGHD